MSTPGATISGLALFPTGPRLENSASRSRASTAPTVSAASAVPGEPTDANVPSLPAATTNSVPCSAVRLVSAMDSGSPPTVGAPPRLMLTTSARGAAHSIPAITLESVP